MFESFSNINKEKRILLIKFHSETLSNIKVENNTDLENEFESHLYSMKFPKFDDDNQRNSLIDATIRYSILCLDEFDYGLKTKGILLLDHLITNTSPSYLNFNMRSNLIFSSLERYLTDKDNLDFMDKALKTVCNLLKIMESKYTSNEHSYRKHSNVINSILNGCYMSTSPVVKCVFYANLINYLTQIDAYSCRHLGNQLNYCSRLKFLTIFN